MEGVSWYDVQIFLTRLNAAEQAAGRLPAGWSHVLPTEAEWEYACRAGTTTAYSFGAELTSDQAKIYVGPRETTDVGKYPANPWGFHDMHGNVWEWTADWYEEFTSGTVIDPVGPAVGVGSDRVFRGGSWGTPASGARSAIRDGHGPAVSLSTLGFRLSLRPPASK